MSVARQVRQFRRRAARERQSLGDALYAIYVVVLFSSYPLLALGEQSAPGPGPLRSAFAGAEPRLLLVAAVAVLVGRSAAAARGGPVVLAPEDARLLLTWPIPRRSLVGPALLAAVVRALATAAAASAVLLYVDIRDLGAPAAAVLRDDLLLPALLAVLTVLVAWQVQVSRRGALVARLFGVALAVLALAALGWLGRKIALDGYLGALQELSRVGPADLPLSGAARGNASSSGLVFGGVLAGLLLPLGLLSFRAAGRATPEELMARSRRADVTRTGLRLGFTSSVYLSRTEPVRRSRRRRWSLPHGPGPVPALIGKAVVQEQGTPVLPRVLACAAITGTVMAAALRVTPGNSFGVTLLWAAIGACGLAIVATRFADPARLDVDRAPLSASIPVRHLVLARIDLGVSAGLASAGAGVGALAITCLGLAPWVKLPELLLAGAAIGILLAAAGALGALSDDPSPFLPPALAIGYRTSGVIAVVTGCLLAAVILRAPSATHAGTPAGTPTVAMDRLPEAIAALLAVAAITLVMASFRATKALTRGR